jgi:hypothetical protein
MDGSSMDDKENGTAYYRVSLQTPLAFANQPDLMVTWNKSIIWLSLTTSV